MDISLTSRNSDSVLGGTQEFAFLASFQIMLMLLFGTTLSDALAERKQDRPPKLLLHLAGGYVKAYYYILSSSEYV